MNMKEFDKIFSDVEFVKTLLLLETGDEVQDTLASRGIKITEDILDRFSKILADTLEKQIADRQIHSISNQISIADGGINENYVYKPIIS